MLDQGKLLELRGVFETVQWDIIENKILGPYLEKTRIELERCPLELVERTRGQIDSLKFLLSLKSAARAAYKERVEEK